MKSSSSPIPKKFLKGASQRLNLKKELSFDKLKEIARNNERFSQIPLICNAWLQCGVGHSSPLPTVFVCRNQTITRNQASVPSIEIFTSQKKADGSEGDLQFTRLPWSMPAKSRNATVSPSGRLRAVFAGMTPPKGGTDAGSGNGGTQPSTVIQLWNDTQLTRVISMDKSKTSGKIHTNGPLSGISFSRSERFLALIAERKQLKHGRWGSAVDGSVMSGERKFYEDLHLSDEVLMDSDEFDITKLNEKKDNALKDLDSLGSAFEFRFSEDWGEQMNGARDTGLFLFDLRTEQFIDPVSAALASSSDSKKKSLSEGDKSEDETNNNKEKKEIKNGCFLGFDTNGLGYLSDIDLNDYSLGEVQFAPDDRSVVVIARQTSDRRLGLKFYNTRPSKLLWIRFEDSRCSKVKSVVDLAPGSWSPTVPRFSPSGSSLVYLTTNRTGPHRAASRLCRLDWPPLMTDEVTVEDDQSIVIIDIDESLTSKQVILDGLFPGIFSSFVEELIPRCWVNETTLLMNTFWRNTLALISVDIMNGTMNRIDHLDSFQNTLAELTLNKQVLMNEGDCRSVLLMDVIAGLALIKISSSQRGQELFTYDCQKGRLSLVCDFEPYIEKLDSVNQWDDSISEQGTSDIPLKSISEIRTRVITVTASDGSDDLIDALVFEPPQSVIDKLSAMKGDTFQPPLLIYPHGGPHSMNLFGFSNLINHFVFEGYIVIQPNYRGSLGFGERFVHSLLSNIGTMDVSDCVDCFRALCDEFPKSTKRICFGWSHSGFLGGHLVAQHPRLFDVCCLGNPVLSLNAEFASTDIPDWVLCEMGVPFDYDSTLLYPLSKEWAARMVEVSPMTLIDQVECPMQILIGCKDVRVPMDQSILYYHLLKARLGPSKVRLLQYPSGQHGLGDSMEESTDVWCNILAWFAIHTSD